MTAPLPRAALARLGAPRRLRSYLLLLALTLLLPSLALGAIVAWSAITAYRAAYEQRLEDTARALALALDREIGIFAATLQGLAVSDQLDADASPQQLAAFHARAREAAAALGSRVRVVGPPPDFRTEFHTSQPAGLPGGESPAGGLRLPPEEAPLPRVFATGRPEVSGIALGRVVQAPSAFVFVPVIRQGRVIRAIGMAVDPARLTSLLIAQGLSGDRYALIVDGRGKVVARSRSPSGSVGRPAMPWYVAGTDGKQTGFLRGANLDDEQVVLGFARLGAAEGWTVAVIEPWSAYAESWQRPLRTLAVGGGAVLLIGIITAGWLARQLLQPVRALAAEAASVVATGQGVSPTQARSYGVTEFEELRRHIAAAAAVLQDRADRARRSEAQFRLALEAGQLGIWEVDVKSGQARRSSRVVPRQDGMPLPGYMLEQFLHRVAHPDDLPMVLRTIEEVVAGRRDHYRVEYRIRQRGSTDWRWMESYGGAVERDPATGRALRLAGVARDVTERRSGEEHRVLLAREIDHRAKNVLAVVQSILRLTRSDGASDFAAAVEARVLALARAHDLLARDSWRGAALRDVLAQELAVFRRPGEDGPRLKLVGPPVELGPAVVQPVEMIAYELATNSAKYGALSVPRGCVRVSWTLLPGGALHLTWRERDGPPLQGAPTRRGFGMRLMEATVQRQLGGTLALHWDSAGLLCEIRLPPGHLRADAASDDRVADQTFRPND